LATARLAARELGCTAETVSGLHENDRTGLPVLPTPEFRERMRQFFAHANEHFMGDETADQAYQRFDRAVHTVIEQHAGTIVVVAHGAVITLFVSRHAGLEPFALWEQLDLPAYVVMSLPGLSLIEIVPSVAAESAIAPGQALEVEK
jgi:broad specificity phosphatase PhoE